MLLLMLLITPGLVLLQRVRMSVRVASLTPLSFILIHRVWRHHLTPSIHLTEGLMNQPNWKHVWAYRAFISVKARDVPTAMSKTDNDKKSAGIMPGKERNSYVWWVPKAISSLACHKKAHALVPFKGKRYSLTHRNIPLWLFHFAD